ECTSVSVLPFSALQRNRKQTNADRDDNHDHNGGQHPPPDARNLTVVFSHRVQIDKLHYATRFGKSRPLPRIRAKRNSNAVPRQPNPYRTLLRKLIDDASDKYLAGQVTSPIAHPSQIT